MENHRKEPAFRLPLGQGQGEKRPNAQRVNMNLKTNKIQTTQLQYVRKYAKWRQSGNKCDVIGFSCELYAVESKR